MKILLFPLRPFPAVFAILLRERETLAALLFYTCASVGALFINDYESRYPDLHKKQLTLLLLAAIPCLL